MITSKKQKQKNKHTHKLIGLVKRRRLQVQPIRIDTRQRAIIEHDDRVRCAANQLHRVVQSPALDVRHGAAFALGYAGDVITEVAQQKVTSPDDVSVKIDAERKAGHKVVLLQVSRGGELTFIGVRLP